MTKAYAIEELTQALRTITLENTGEIILNDTFEFTEKPFPVEEAFVTWQDVKIQGNQVQIHSDKGYLEIISQNSQGNFDVEVLEEASQANLKKGVLKRITFTAPENKRQELTFVMRFVPLQNDPTQTN